jgi:hypothetical protein
VILERHNDAASEAFENAIAAMPEVIDCFSVSGDADYMLRIVVPDLASVFRIDDEAPAVPARRCPHQDQHCPADGKADACPASRSPDVPAEQATPARAQGNMPKAQRVTKGLFTAP